MRSASNLNGPGCLALAPILAFLGLLRLSCAGEETTTTFEDPAVSGVPVTLPSWSEFGPVVLQYGNGLIQDSIAGEGAQALHLSPGNPIAGSAVTWSPQKEAEGGARAVTSFLVRHDSFSTADPVIPAGDLRAVLFINDTGLHALDGDGRGGGTWQFLRPLTPTVFHKITVIRDDAKQTYQVVLDGNLIGENCGFKNRITGSNSLSTFETSGEVWLDELSTSFLADRTPPSPDPMTWAVPPAPGTPTGGLADALSTDFVGRTVSESTAGNLSWTTDGLADPGGLTAIDVNNTGRLAGLFTSIAAVDRFIPNLNILNEGPWQISLPLIPTEAPLVLQEVVLEFQHLGNGGTIPIINKRGKFTVTLSGSTSGLLRRVALIHTVLANDGSGAETFTFDPPLTLDDRETYTLTILAEENGSGANVGLESLTIHRVRSAIIDTASSVRMVASSASDLSGVEYFFECTSGGGTDSGWQASAEYLETGLAPGTRYTYRTRSRDRSSSQNPGGWSLPATATTSGTPPVGRFAAWIASFDLDPSDQDFSDDPDGDQLTNGIEAWWGTHPGEPNPGLTLSRSDGLTTTFTHAAHEMPPTDLNGSHQWSTDLIDWYAGDGQDGPDQGATVSISSRSTGNVSTVTAVASETQRRLYFRTVVVYN